MTRVTAQAPLGGTWSGTRLSRTRVNQQLPPDAQELDIKLQMSRPSVLADLERVGGSVPPGVHKLIAEHGTDGRYTIEKPLAHGGMGAVLLIRDGDFQRPAAMKVMLSRYAASSEALERFLAEAQVTAQLEHPNIVPIHDLGVMQDGTVYFTMKYIEGESLGSVVKKLKSADAAVREAARREWTEEKLLLTFLKVLDGMSYAHAKGVVHRDIKPDNIMLGRHGEVLVVDWGIAKVLAKPIDAATRSVVNLRQNEEALSLTQEGAAMGTLFYMPPEQARGDLAAIDQRSDIYALGATLYELLTGERPVSGRSAPEILAKVAAGEITHILTVKPDLHQDLAAIVMKMLAFEPAQRYASCGEVSEDIRRYLAGQAVLARRRNLIERFGAWVARHRRQVAIAAGGLAIATFAAAAAWWWAEQREQQRIALLVERALAAAAVSQWQEAYDAAVAAGAVPAALEIKERAAAALALAAREREEAARRQAAELTARRLLAEAQQAAARSEWQEARDKAKAALEAARLPEAEELLALATARLADARRLALEATARARKEEGDRALAEARGLALLDARLPELLDRARAAYAQSTADGVAVPGIEAAVAELAALQQRVDEARAAAARAEAERQEQERRRRQAAEARRAAQAALAQGDLEAAAEQAAIARRLAADDSDGELNERIVAARLRRDAERAAAAARAQARATAQSALAQARAADAERLRAAEQLASVEAEVQRLTRELAHQPADGKRPLFAAQEAARAARSRMMEQWSLAEGAARTALDALREEPQHPDAVAARQLLIALYRMRWQEAVRSGDEAARAAFGTLLTQLGSDPEAEAQGQVLVTAAVQARRLEEDGVGRFVPVGETRSLPAGQAVTLPHGRWQLRDGDQVAAIVVRPGQLTRLAWAPGPPPEVGMRLRWVPFERGFWLAEHEVTVRHYAAFLADPAVAAEVKETYRAWMRQQRDDLALFPRQGAGLDLAVWQAVAEGDELRSWQPIAKALEEPVRGISRSDAERYCAWLARRTGKRVRLPTLAEWRYAATGGDERRIFPWGPRGDHALAVCAVPKRDHPAAVGSAPDDLGPFGHRDLAGSVREWVTDRGLAYDARVAGGGWTDEDLARLRSDAVESLPAHAAFAAIGFRILVEP
ncbi:MAG: bifunctional serine/threonine-protein kinase/formylglycine-generating enzyme family protein [Planctomycetota bacterium]|nr:bifunctional serine/threonine-protein kinase/formylglycine-generating enzyme family protein [Planctomycetota bacterium]